MKIAFPTPSSAIVAAPAKLNLYLEVFPPRADGYHDIDSLFQAISLADTLRFDATTDGRITLDESGIAESEQNLVHRAATALREALGSPANGARIRLEKSIPQGAGLGGGSSDAAATLVALAKIWGIASDRRALAALGATLGSDVPFFVHGGTARCEGRGERVTPLAAFDRAAPIHYVVVFPRVHTPTGAVYRALDAAVDRPLTPPSPFDSMTSDELVEGARRGRVLFNRLEAPCLGLFPQLEGIASTMRALPFVGAQLTGSGSAFFGICRDEEDAKKIAWSSAERFADAADVFAVRSLAAPCFDWLPERR